MSYHGLERIYMKIIKHLLSQFDFRFMFNISLKAYGC